MDFADLQARLQRAGYDPGPIDGRWGASTLTAVMAAAAGHIAGPQVRELAEALVTPMVGKDITTPLRICHFLAQGCHETGGWRFLTELGNDSYFARYDGRKDLGNTQPGDGYLYRGRGIFQITGRANYTAYGVKLVMPLVGQPELAAEPDGAAKIAVAYWDDHGLNLPADHDDLNTITRRINGGLNGYPDRAAILARLKTMWGL